MKKNLLGFTLAEVLITLGIIGIVAAMTIPTLIQNAQKQSYVTGLKKAYTVWNQAIAQMEADTGTPGNIAMFFDATDKPMTDKILPYFKVAKNCYNGNGCWANRQSRCYDGKNPLNGYDESSSYKFITTDGMAFRLNTINPGCVGVNDGMQNICIQNLYVDVNGLKGPNWWGRDIFLFTLDSTDGKTVLYPQGGKRNMPWSTNGCQTTNVDGQYCAGRIMEEGWEMNY